MNPGIAATIAYCGPAPVPASLWGAWNLDVYALALCAILLVLHLVRGGRDGHAPPGAAIGVLLILFVSPLCALTVALFSARVAHHAVLVGIAAPLLAMCFPRRAGSRDLVSLPWLVAAFAVVLWFWHVPVVYGWAIAGPLSYWTMQGTMLLAGWALWRRILSTETHAGSALLALLATTIQMGLLGALLTFARDPLYAPHALTTAAFGLSPREDQQLAGLIMWVPAALPFLAAALWKLAALLDSAARAGQAPSRS